MESACPAPDALPDALGVIRELTRALARADAAPVVYEHALGGLRRALGVARASILTFDPDGVARFRAWTGLSDTYRDAVDGHCPWKPGARDAAPLAIPDVRAETSLAAYRESFTRENIRALAFIPLMGAAGCLGKFVLYYDEIHEFTAGELAVAEVIATQAAYAAERVSTAEAGRLQAARLAEQAALLDLAHDAILVITMTGEIVYWSAGAAKMYGYSAEEARGRVAHDLLRTVFSDPLQEMQSRLLRQGVWEGELVHTTRDGAERIVSSRWALRPAHDGVPAGILEINRDITEQKRHERALRVSEERYRSLVQATSAVVFHADALGRFADPQDGWERYTGQPWPEHRGAAWLSAFHADDAAKVRAAWDNALELRARCWTEGRLRHAASGEHRHVLLAAVPIMTEDGRVREWVGALTDVHERRQMEARLRDAAKLESLGVLAGGIAHDFNNLLTGILGGASLLQEELADRFPLRSRVDMILEASERAAALTRQMLAYSGRGHFFIESLDIAASIADMRGLIDASLPKSVRLRVELPPSLPPVKADAGQFQQLMMNLLVNAGEAIAGAGAVTVSADLQDVAEPRHASGGDLAPGEYVVIRVADTGIGMDADTLARIFDPFFSTKFTGRGLGLAAALGIARGHGGAIEVHSSPGEGAVFSVFLPVARPSARQSILVIDDEEIVLRTARAALERHGYHVVTAIDGREGVGLFASANPPFDVVLLDMTMPVMSGEEALRRIRELDPRVPVIGSSGYNEKEARNRFGAGLSGFLQKPYNTQRLAQLIASTTT